MNKYILEVTGMKCGMCEAHMNEAIKKSFKVKSVASSHDKNEVVVIAREAISEEEFKKVVDAAGYTLGSVKQEEATRHFLSWK